jgi:WD40 repeat protein
VSDRRRCAACGVRLPVDAARCPTCGHADGDPVVAEHDPGRRSANGRRTAFIAIAVVLALIGVLALVDRRSEPTDDHEGAAADATTTSVARSPIATPSTADDSTSDGSRSFDATITLAPGDRLLGWIANGEVEILDPATETITTSSLGSAGQFVTIVPRLGGAVVALQSGRVLWLAELPPATDVSTLLAAGDDIIASDLPDRIWLQRGFNPVHMTEVDLRTGESVVEVDLPPSSYPFGSIEGGLVLGAPDGLYRYRRGSDRFDVLARAEYVASSGRLLATRTCDDRLVCHITVTDVGGRTTEMAQAEIGSVLDAAFSPDGRWLAVAADESPSSWRVLVYDLRTGEVQPAATGPARLSGIVGLSWSSDGEWVLWPEFPGIRGFHPADNTAAFIDTDGGGYQAVAVLAPPEPSG